MVVRGETLGGEGKRERRKIGLRVWGGEKKKRVGIGGGEEGRIRE